MTYELIDSYMIENDGNAVKVWQAAGAQVGEEKISQKDRAGDKLLIFLCSKWRDI